MTRAEGESPGQIVVSDTVRFNARQKPWKQYLPYFETGTLDFVEPSFSTGFTENFYDGLGREVRVNQPTGPEGTVWSQTTYGPLTRTVQDEEQTRPGSPHRGCGLRYVEDGLRSEEEHGRLREVYEIVRLSDVGEPLNEPVEWRTTYSYDLLDNLTGYTDSRGNRKTITYDGLGRKTRIVDPDSGTTSYAYDAAGNLVKTVDAEGQVILYDYDGVNRLLREFHGERKTQADVDYHYDLPFGPVDRGDLWQKDAPGAIVDAILEEQPYDIRQDLNQDARIDAADVVKSARDSARREANRVTAQNTLGFLSWVRDSSGEEHNSYDSRGRVVWVVKRIMDASRDELRNFITGMAYDSMDRVTRLTYPDRSHVTHQYNSRGLLEAIPNVISRHDYNPAGETALVELAAGVVTAYRYDHRLRLSRLKTDRERDGLVLQDLGYTYDGASNITRIVDGRSQAALDTIGGELGISPNQARKFRASQSFVYDSLYRLTQAANPAVYGTVSYRYDRIGNMIRKEAALLDPDPLMDLGDMSYGGPSAGPHAVTGTARGPDGPMSFAYDKNGNLLADRGGSLSWDHRSRLASFVKGAQSTRYVYDYTDTRVSKTTRDPARPYADQSVDYIDEYSEWRGGKLIKYVYSGTNRVARADGCEAQSTPLRPDYFYLCDHLGSAALTLEDDATVREQLSNYPFGRPRYKHSVSFRSVTDYVFTSKELDEESGLHYFLARYYHSAIGRFISVDPLDWLEWQHKDASLGGEDVSSGPNQLRRIAGDKRTFFKFLKIPQNQNLYSYVLNGAINATDPLGLYFGVDDAIFTAAGALVGLAAQGLTDLMFRDISSVSDYAAAAVGGAVAGELLLYTGPLAAGYLGAATGNLARQGLYNLTGKQRGFDHESLGVEALIGTATGVIPGVRMRGITVGRNSCNKFYREMVTKANNHTISRVSIKTAGKMLVGRAVDTSFPIGATIGAPVQKLISNFSSK
jgi:RHS repeat-associated protein